MEGHAHERRQCDNVSEQDNSRSDWACPALPESFSFTDTMVTFAQTMSLTPLAGVRHTLLCVNNSVCLSAKLRRHMG